MYSLYQKQGNNGQIELHYLKTIHLAGCNNGLIANNLEKKLILDKNPPIGWTLPISNDLNKDNQLVIIDIKPKNREKPEIFLCELDTVIGFSFESWTPIMFRLNILIANVSPDKIDKFNFIYPKDCDIIYTMLYLSGSFRNGKLIGTWNYPGPSSTNALLLWPEALTFFNHQINKLDQGFFNKKVDSF
jgi:hypothetical protein